MNKKELLKKYKTHDVKFEDLEYNGSVLYNCEDEYGEAILTKEDLIKVLKKYVDNNIDFNELLIWSVNSLFSDVMFFGNNDEELHILIDDILNAIDDSQDNENPITKEEVSNFIKKLENYNKEVK
jgi:hypothetical protein